VTKPFHLLASLILLGTLAACGGGGDSAPTPVTPPPAAGPTRGYELVTTSPSATYAPGTAQDVIYSRLNTLRLAVGAGALTQSTALDTAAAGHLAYLAAHQPYIGHDQIPGHAGFTGANIFARAEAAGYAVQSVAENLAYTPDPSPVACLEKLMNSVYHQSSLLSEFRDVGLAHGPVGQSLYGCAIEYGLRTGAYWQMTDAGFVKGYPYGGQTGVDTTFVPASEIPNPMPEVGGNFVGHPILASMRAFGVMGPFTVSSFTLKDGSGNLVPVRIIGGDNTTGPGVTADTLDILAEGDVYMVPLSALLPATTYTVEFVGAAGPAQPYSKTWSFTTR
jgi:uncharacterized protein YkwD